jgi:hypothetical protein
VFAQVAEPTTKKVDSTPYAFRFGIDISKPMISAINNEEEISYEFVTDLQFSEKWFAAVEFGSAQKNSSDSFLKFSTKGNYVKLGFNYNLFENLSGMNNEILVGARYGYSDFEHRLNSFTINSNDLYFENPLNEVGQNYPNLSAHWLELISGIKVETFKNLYLGTSISVNILLSQKTPDNFLNMYIPGFNRLYSNKLGIGFNYTLSYKIPIRKSKSKKV